MHAENTIFAAFKPRFLLNGNFLLPSAPLPFRLDTVRQTPYFLHTTASAVVT